MLNEVSAVAAWGLMKVINCNCCVAGSHGRHSNAESEIRVRALGSVLAKE